MTIEKYPASKPLGNYFPGTGGDVVPPAALNHAVERAPTSLLQRYAPNGLAFDRSNFQGTQSAAKIHRRPSQWKEPANRRRLHSLLRPAHLGRLDFPLAYTSRLSSPSVRHIFRKAFLGFSRAAWH